MPRALFGLLLAASALSPAAAIAQHHEGDGDGRRDRGGWHGGESRGQSPRQAQPARQAPQVRQAPPQVQGGPSPQAFQRRGEGWQGRANGEARGGGWQGNRGPQAPQQTARPGARPEGYRGDRAPQGRPGSIYPQAWQGNPNDPRLRHYQELERRNQYRYGTPQQREAIRRYDGPRAGARGNRNWGRDWNRGWRGDRRYDWQRYRVGNRHVFHLSPYYAPYRNWNYRRFSIGLFLDPLFYGQNYWIGDPYYYRLPPAPPGTEWVRYYNDVLLVDVYSGEVVDAIYDFFW